MVAIAKDARRSRTHSVVYVALSVALMAIGAWITVPFGAVPFTLQTFAVMFALFVLAPREALVAIAAYLVLGAIGLPVFAGFSGGISALLGPTGGFLIGFFVAAAIALTVGFALGHLPIFASKEEKEVLGSRVTMGTFFHNLLVGIVFMVVLYLFGWVWLSVTTGMTMEAAFAAAVAPFVLIDACKMLAACLVAQAVRAVI